MLRNGAGTTNLDLLMTETLSEHGCEVNNDTVRAQCQQPNSDSKAGKGAVSFMNMGTQVHPPLSGNDALSSDGGAWLLSAAQHLARQQWQRAEIALRTAAALGEAPENLAADLEIAMSNQGESLARHPLTLPRTGAASQRRPTALDIAVLARMAWQTSSLDDKTTVDYLRYCATCDEVLAKMIEDPRFERANMSWMHYSKDGDF